MLYLSEEEKYIRMRLRKAWWMSLPFYICRIFHIKKNKISFTCIEGTTGFTCNPKYIAKEMINQGLDYDSVWLVNDIKKAESFPKEIKVVKNTLWNRAFHLTTSKWWIDNSRKQLECRKRKGQIYIQTWHAKLGFKPTCLDRGASFSKIAYMVSKHDSDMVDYWLSNSDWYDKTLKTGSLYEGKTLRMGSPRCDILINGVDKSREDVRAFYKIEKDAKILMYAPTFRGGSQSTDRSIEAGNHFPNYDKLKENLEKRFGGKWYIMTRLHPQLVARGMNSKSVAEDYLLDGSEKDDMYELLAGCDAFMTDYSSAAFDAMVMEMPIFLYCDDYKDYEDERGSLLWDLRKLPFPLSEDNEGLSESIINFDSESYKSALKELLDTTQMIEDGTASRKVVEFITKG